MNKHEFIEKLKAQIDEEQTRCNQLPENDFLSRGISLGIINGLLRAWEIAQHTGD